MDVLVSARSRGKPRAPEARSTYATLDAALLLALFIFSWKSVGWTHFDGLDTPLFLALSGFCLWQLSRFPLELGKAAIAPYLIWLGWISFSDFYSLRFAAGFARDAHWLILPFFASICARLFRDDARLIPLLRLGAAGSLLAIALHLVFFPSHSANWLIEPVFGHVRHLCMAVGLLLVWVYDDAHLGPSGRALLVAGRFTGLVTLLWTGGRGAPIALALALGAFFFLYAPARKRLPRYLIELALAFGVSELISLGNARHGLFSGLFRSISAESVDALSSSRLTIWGNALARLAEGYTLWTGSGGNGYIRLGLARQFIFHPHNIVLQVLTDWGIVGLLVFANYLRVVLLPLRQAPFSEPGEALAVSIIVFLTAMGMIDGGLYHLQFLVAIGIAFGLLHRQLPQERGATVILLLGPLLLILLMVIDHLRLS